jgi:2-deoxy-D-gluconate 3-dehydrogenase
MTHTISLEGKVALVTGSTRGIGAEVAVALARAGADVVCHGSSSVAEDTQARVAKLGRRVHGIRADLATRAGQDALIREGLGCFERVDILVHSAGAIRRAPAVDFADQDWDALLEIDLTCVFRITREIGRTMLARGRGHIVNIASLLSFQGGILVPAYAAAKGGIASLTKAFANEWAVQGVNVNAIAPGYIATDNTEALRADSTRSRQILERIPAQRWGKPEDIADAAVFLCSDGARYIHGHMLVVDGGWMGR